MAVRRDESALVLALARGESVPAAAKAAGFSERTARRRASDPDVRQAVSRARCDLLAQAVGILAEPATEAARTLAGLLTTGSDSIKLRAAAAILGAAMTGTEQADVADRLVALEEALAQNLFDARTENPWRR